ncbi:MAG: hypothetical protein AAF968_27400, partial [Pseudomonadota bacterium]
MPPLRGEAAWVRLHGEPVPGGYVRLWQDKRSEGDAGLPPRASLDWVPASAGPFDFAETPLTIEVADDSNRRAGIVFAEVVADMTGRLDEREGNWLAGPAMVVGRDDTYTAAFATHRDADRIRLDVPEGASGAFDLSIVQQSTPLRFHARLWRWREAEADDEPGGYEEWLPWRHSAGGRLNFEGLALPPGRYGVEIRADGSKSWRDWDVRPYELRLAAVPLAEDGHEQEPNDLAISAQPMGERMKMSGVTSGDDADVFSFEVDDADMLWRVTANGGERMEILDASGRAIASYTRPKNARQIRAESLDFLPGTYHVRMSGDGSYRLRVRPLGVAPPDFEREPNDTLSGAGRIRVGEMRRGLLPPGDPVDRYVFRLDGRDRMRLQITAPDDGGMDIRITHLAMAITDTAIAPGETLDLRREFEAGFYEIALEPRSSASIGPYRLSLMAEDEWPAPGQDNEPNSGPGFASPVPPGGRLAGVAGAGEGWDWFVMPMPPEPGRLIHICE